jgi:protein-S-isoprenylcysteine O-methyltransferase Ste14
VAASETISVTQSATVKVIGAARRKELTPAQALFVLITILLVVTSVFGSDMPAEVSKVATGLWVVITELAAAWYFWDKFMKRHDG